MNSNWSYSPETSNLGQIRQFFTSVTLTFDLWPRPFAWTSLLSLVITPENFMMIRRWEHSQKGVTDGRTDWRTQPIHRAAWSQLKKRRYKCPDHYILAGILVSTNGVKSFCLNFNNTGVPSQRMHYEIITSVLRQKGFAMSFSHKGDIIILCPIIREYLSEPTWRFNFKMSSNQYTGIHNCSCRKKINCLMIFLLIFIVWIPIPGMMVFILKQNT